MKNERVSQIIFCLILLTLPFQTGKVFFTRNSFYFGFHAFYNSFFLYLTDILIFGLVTGWFIEYFSREKHPLWVLKNRIQHDSLYLFTLAFWLIFATSLIFSRENTLGAYGLLKVTEFLLFFAYIRENSATKTFSREKIPIHEVFWLLVISSLFQAILATAQYLTQSSFGLRALGEEFLRPGLPGVAKILTHGIANPLLYQLFPSLSTIFRTNLAMRGYGTFPHPNLLGAYLFVALILCLYLIYFSRAKFWPLVLIVLGIGVSVTFSRLGWLATFAGITLFLALIFTKLRTPYLDLMKSGQAERSHATVYFPSRVFLIVASILISLGLNIFLFGPQIKDRLIESRAKGIVNSESVLNRKAFSSVAWKMFSKNPIFGVGFRNFVVEMDRYSKERLLPYQHQPVHNIYLLLLAETGILGFTTFVLITFDIVRRGLKKNNSPLVGETLLIIFFGLLGLGFFDHYILSLHQGGLLFWLVSGLLASDS